MIYALYTIHIAISLFLIMVVLLQSGRSADLSALGGGATQTTFGARGATNLLHRLTVICFVLFIVTTLTIGIFQSGGTTSVMDDVASPPAAASADAAEDESAPAPDDQSQTEDQAPDEPSEGASAASAGEQDSPSPEDVPPAQQDPNNG